MKVLIEICRKPIPRSPITRKQKLEKGKIEQLKYILIIGDGMADYQIPELGNMTPLQVAYKPNMDFIAAKGQNGLLHTIPSGMNAGSDIAILSVLGYDPNEYYTGRGPFEAVSKTIQLEENDVAFRCNLITEEDGILVDYSAEHITSEEAQRLLKTLMQNRKRPDEFEFHSGLDYRHFLILRNSPEALQIECTPPHDAIGAKISDILPKAQSEEAEKTANLLKQAVIKSKEILETHPINIRRRKKGKRPGNMIWPWGGGKKPSLPSFKEKYHINSAVISAVDLVKGIGIFTGMRVINVPGATGLYNTNYEGKADHAIRALDESDMVFVHVEAPDEAGHARDYKLKIKTIEDLDRRLLGRLLNGVKEPYGIAILPDHPTPIRIGTHARDPVPFAIYTPFIKADSVTKFDEVSAKNGTFGLVRQGQLMPLLLSSTSNK